MFDTSEMSVTAVLLTAMLTSDGATEHHFLHPPCSCYKNTGSGCSSNRLPLYHARNPSGDNQATRRLLHWQWVRRLLGLSAGWHQRAHTGTASTTMNRLYSEGLLMPLSPKVNGAFVVHGHWRQRTLNWNSNRIIDERLTARQQPADVFYWNLKLLLPQSEQCGERS